MQEEISTEYASAVNENFYKDGAEYWSKIPATVNGMLGGFADISMTDIRGSKALFKQLFASKNRPLNRGYALDCGAGIGRITKFLLSDIFERVDMVEQNPQFLESAKKYLGPSIMEKKIGQMFPVGLQHFQPEPEKYDVIWCQWVLGHLTDEDFVAFFQRCKLGIKPNGVIIAKENISYEEVEVDTTDSSVTRPIGLVRELFDKAGLDCCRMVKQLGLPKGLFTVYMFVLKPKNEENEKASQESENLVEIDGNEKEINSSANSINKS